MRSPYTLFVHLTTQGFQKWGCDGHAPPAGGRRGVGFGFTGVGKEAGLGAARTGPGSCRPLCPGTAQLLNRHSSSPKGRHCSWCRGYGGEQDGPVPAPGPQTPVWEPASKQGHHLVSGGGECPGGSWAAGGGQGSEGLFWVERISRPQGSQAAWPAGILGVGLTLYQTQKHLRAPQTP